MFPAARITDPVTHDLLVPSGVIAPQAPAPCPRCSSAVVLIEGLPAAHLGCTVVCTGVITGGIAHPPPPPTPPVPIVGAGALNVLIHGRPAARWVPSGDFGACGVLLGDPKLAAARTVLVGGAAFPYAVVRQPDGSIRVGNHMVIEGTPEYQARVLAHLSTVAMTTDPDGTFSEGRDTMDRVNNGRHDVTIRDWETPDQGNECRPASMADAQDPTRGSASTVFFNPDNEPPTAADPSVNRPADVGLHHELGHAGSASDGAVDLSAATNPNNPHMEEETNIARDNRYRTARGVPNRADHHSL